MILRYSGKEIKADSPEDITHCFSQSPAGIKNYRGLVK